MERPKSAKHNLERYKKSAYTNYKRNNRVSNNTSSQSSYLDNSSSTNTSFYFNNNTTNIQANDTDLISTTPIEAQFVEDNGNLTPSALRRKEQRYQTSKSAFVGSISKLRPQSARHNLEKYRQDVLIEQQRKLQKLQLLQQQQQQVLSVTPNQMQQDINQIEPDIENNLVVNTTNMFGDDDDDDDIDNLDGLLIREEDSSSDLDSNHSGSNKNLADPSKTNLKKSNKIKLTAINPNNNTQQTSLNKKSKLLARRTGGPTNPANPTNGANNNNNLRLSAAKEHAQLANLPNKSASFNHYTTFRPTAVTTTYSTNPLQPSSNINSILVQQQQQQQQQCSSSLSNYGSNVVTLHPTSSNINFDNGAEIENQHLANTTAASTSTNTTTTTTATNSSSSSSSSTSSKNQQLLLQQQQVVHLNEAESNLNGRQKQINDITSQELLNEWYKNDDEVDLRINNNSNYGELERRRVLVQQQQPIIHHQNSAQQRFVNPPSKQSQSQQQQIILANNNGRTSRFSDYSANSNIINTKSNNQNGYVITKEKSSVMDSWTKRNPALVAQNVLLKHKAELEKLSTSRNTNNSQASNASLLTTTTTTNKYLLPDAKYFKK